MYFNVFDKVSLHTGQTMNQEGERRRLQRRLEYKLIYSFNMRITIYPFPLFTVKYVLIQSSQTPDIYGG